MENLPVEHFGVIVRKTARSALYHFFKSAAEILGKRKVLLPSFCCQSVYLSAMFAGCKPVLIDVDLKNFSLDLKDLSEKIDKNTLSVLFPHMFGIYGFSNIERIKALQHQFPETIWLEDACQTYGPRKDKTVSFGVTLDFGLFSCDPVKPIQGRMGLLVQNKKSDRFDAILQSIKTHPGLDIEFSEIEELKRLESAYFTSIVSMGRLFAPKWKPNKEFLEVIEKLYVDNAPPLEKFCFESTENMVNSYNVNRKDINSNYEHFFKKLNPFVSGQIVSFEISRQDMIWRYPIIVLDESKSAKLSNLLRDNGLNCSNHYYPISGLFELNNQSCPNSEYLTNRIINIWFNNSMEAEKCVNIFKEFLSEY